MTFLQTVLGFFQHKKWLAALGVVLGLVGASLTGDMTWADAINQIVKVVIATIIAQGAVDVSSTIKRNGTTGT